MQLRCAIVGKRGAKTWGGGGGGGSEVRGSKAKCSIIAISGEERINMHVHE